VSPVRQSWRAAAMGLFSSDEDSDEDAAFAKPATNVLTKTSGGLFGDSDSDSEDDHVDAHGSAPTAKSQPGGGGGGGGLFGDSDDEDEDGGISVGAKPAPKPSARAKSSGGLFGESDSDDDGGGPSLASPAPAPVPTVAAAAHAPAAAAAAKPSGGSLFGDDSDEDSDAAGLFGGGSSKPAAGEGAATGGLFSKAAASDDEGGLFGSARDTKPSGGTSAAPELTPTSTEAAVAGQWDQSSIGSLIDMGFARVDAEAALAASGGDVQQAADWLLVGGTAAAAERTSLSAGHAPSPAATAPADGGLDQSSAFLGVTVFTRPAASAPDPAIVGGRGQHRRPSLGDRVTVTRQPRNSDFLQPGQVGTVVEIDDMDVEDIWFTVEDADGETDEYCEADLIIADDAAGAGAAAAGPVEPAPAPVQDSIPPGFETVLRTPIAVPTTVAPVLGMAAVSVPPGFGGAGLQSVPPGFSLPRPDSEAFGFSVGVAVPVPVAVAVAVAVPVAAAAAAALPGAKPNRGVFSDSDDEDSGLTPSDAIPSVFDEVPPVESKGAEGTQAAAFCVLSRNAVCLTGSLVCSGTV
jgi:hypothetical protein